MISSLILWFVLWMAAVASAAMGLCVSCFSQTLRFALTIVPLLLIPQIIFGGLIRPLADLDKNTFWPQIIGNLTVQRWAFEASLNVDPFGNSGVLEQLIDSKGLDAVTRYEDYAELNVIRYQRSSIIKSFFRSREDTWKNASFFFPMGCLVFFTVFFLGISYYALKRKFLL
jgi:hypothetical protein